MKNYTAFTHKTAINVVTLIVKNKTIDKVEMVPTFNFKHSFHAFKKYCNTISKCGILNYDS